MPANVPLDLLETPMLLVFVEDEPLDIIPHEPRRSRRQASIGGLTEPTGEEIDRIRLPRPRRLLDALTVERVADLPDVPDLDDLTRAAGAPIRSHRATSCRRR